MAKRAASSKATRGASKGRKVASSSSSNPKTRKFRSQYNSLAIIAKGGPSKKAQNKEANKNAARSAADRQKLLAALDSINLINTDDLANTKTKSKKKDCSSIASDGTKLTTASFASIWSNCTNSSLAEFFNVWNPNLETHKDALAVIAGLSQTMSSASTEQSDEEFARTLFSIISSQETPVNVITGALLALTFVIRKLNPEVIIANFDEYCRILKSLMEKYHESKRKTLIKCLLRCFARLSKVHPLGKKAFESSLKKKIHIALRQYKVQNKIDL